MRKLFLSLCILIALGSHAQKFDREWFGYQNTHLPSKLIYDQLKTYGVNVMVNNSNMYTMDPTFANNLAIAFTSYDKVDYSNADMKATVVYGPCSFIEEKTSSSVREEEVNKVKVKVTYYKRILTFRFPISYKLVNGKNNVPLYTNEFSSTNIRTIETAEFKSESEASNYLNSNRNSFVNGHVNELCTQFMKNSNAVIREMFDFFTNQANLEIYQVKKWDKDDEYNGHVKNVTNIIKSQTADEQPEVVKAKLEKDIAYFQSFDGVFKADDKKEDILYFINNFNLATIFFCLDDFEKAKSYIQKLEISDKQEGSTKNLNNYIKSAETRTAKHFVTNTHLTYNPVKDYRLAGKQFQSDAASATENIASSMNSGKVEATDKVVMTDNKEIVGKIIFVKERGELQMIPKDSPDKPVVLTPINCQKFNIDSVNYVVVKNKGNGSPVKQFYLVHYSSDKIKLIQYVNNSFVPDGAYVGFIRPAEEFVTFGTGLGVKKKLASYFEDCKDVSEKAKDGDFGGAFSKDLLGNFKRLCAEYDACK
ncbi:MAG TPA: hypothetical protein VF476_18745 [Chitinophagaceae bacterium]